MRRPLEESKIRWFVIKTLDTHYIGWILIAIIAVETLALLAVQSLRQTEEQKALFGLEMPTKTEQIRLSGDTASNQLI